MRAAFALLLPALLLGAAPGALAKDHAPSLLSAADLDPRLVLPAPPAAGSAQARAELAELHMIEQSRTPDEAAAAKAMGDIKRVAIFAAILGPRFDLARLPATVHLFDIVHTAEKDAVDRGKDAFKRPRPWIADPTVKTCAPGEEPLSSYPSGHATSAYATGEVLARLLPARAPAILARAAQYGESRIVCEQHFRSDVAAGALLGAVIAERLMAKPEFVAAFAAAQKELTAAGL